MLWCVWCLSDVQSDFLGFPPLPSCLVNHADISWFWQIWHIYEAGYLSAQQEQKSVSFISLANADRWCSCTIFGRDLQDIPDLQYFAVGRVAIYPESRNLFHYTALMTDPNSRGLTNSGNATICNGSTHWSITGGHLLCSPSHLILLFLHSHILVLNMKANIVLFFSLQFHWFWKQKKQQQQQTKKQVLPAESGGQEAIRSSVCFAHQHKEAVDSLATPTLCPSAHQSFADTKRNVTCSSNGQRKQRADPRLLICSNWQWECRWVGMMLMSPAAGKGQWASEFVRKKLSKCWTLLTAGSVTTHRLGHQDKTLP